MRSTSSCVLRVCSFFPSLSPIPLHYMLTRLSFVRFLVPGWGSGHDMALGELLPPPQSAERPSLTTRNLRVPLCLRLRLCISSVPAR